MPDTVALARQKLLDGGYTCFVLLGQEEYFSFERGVKPLLSFLQSGTSFLGAVAADKTVGAGAAHLYVLLGVSAVWANVMSQPAKTVLEQNGIAVFYQTLVPNIINRQGTDLCPMERAVLGAENSLVAKERILRALEKLQSQPN